MKPDIQFTLHAENMLAERGIERTWVEAALHAPDWTEPDNRPDRRRAFREIPEAEGKFLRVVYAEGSGEIRVITEFFDRNAKKP